GATWSAPVSFATLQQPVCTFPPTCFNISGGPFRSGGTYPAPAFDAARDRLYVIAADIRGTYAQTYFWSLNPHTLQVVRGPVAVAPGAGDQFQSEISTSAAGRIDGSFYDRRYSANALVDL